jgi:hypothetical protein
MTMTDAKRWIDDIRHAEPPELWETIEQRVAGGGPAGQSPRSTRPLLAAGILVISVLVLGSVFYALGRIGERGERSIGGPAAGEIVRYRFDGPPQPLVVGDGAAWVKVGAGDGTAHYLARIDAATGAIVRIDVPGGDWPAVGGGSAWLLCNARACGEGAVLQLDPETGDIVRTVPLPARGNQIAGVADGVWITTEAGLTFVNAAGEAVRNFELPNPNLLASDGSDLWVEVGNAVVRVDPTTGEQLTRVAFGNVCTMDAAGGLVWLASCSGGYGVQGAPDADVLMGADATGGVLFRVPIEGYGQMRYAEGVLWLAQNDPTDERRLRILRFDPRTGEDLGQPITIVRGEPVYSIRAFVGPHVFFAVGEGSLWLTEFGAGEVIRVGLPSARSAESSSVEPVADVVVMPDLVGVQISDAIRELDQLGLTATTIEIEDDSQLGEPGADDVVAQDPGAGAEVATGTGVSLTVTAIPHSMPSPAPDEETSSILRVSCEGGITTVLTPMVRARSDGLHVEVVGAPDGVSAVLLANSSYVPVRHTQWSSGSDGVDGEFTRPVPPGEGRVLCAEEGMQIETTATSVRSWPSFEIVAPSFDPYELACAEQTSLGAGFEVDDWTDGYDFIRKHVDATSPLSWAIRAGYPEERSFEWWIAGHEDRTVAAFLVRPASGMVLDAIACTDAGVMLSR